MLYYIFYLNVVRYNWITSLMSCQEFDSIFILSFFKIIIKFSFLYKGLRESLRLKV